MQEAHIQGEEVCVVR